MIFYPHKIKGKLIVGRNCSGQKRCLIDGSGNITIGDDVIFTRECMIYTHEHPMKRFPSILKQTKEEGVSVSDLKIGDDVYFGARCIVLSSVTKIPRGTVVAAGAVLTKNPDCEYGVYAGVPAKKIGERIE